MDIDIAIAEVSKNRTLDRRGSQFLTSAFLQCLGNSGEGRGTSTVLDGSFMCPENTTDTTIVFGSV